MGQTTYHFPRGFLWGAATASHQVEGNNTNNNWWAWEQQPGKIKLGQKSGLACDWWGGRWREDFDRAADAGQNAHRLSVEWSRIQPAPDRWDEDALDHYREMLQGLHNRGMTPMVTLHHFSNPIWLEEMGGWENEAVVELFVKYTEKVVEALREYVTLWCTINEPNVYAVEAFVMGHFPPGKTDIGAFIKVSHNQVRAHAAAYKAIHRLQPTARVGIAQHIRWFEPNWGWNPFDGLATGLQMQIFNYAFPQALKDGKLRLVLSNKTFPEAKGTQDYLGINYYTREFVSFDLLRAGELFGRRYYAQGVELSHTGFLANEPSGFFKTLEWANSFGLPIIVTENGVEDPDDTLRPRYLTQHLHQMWKAVNFNFPIKGYFHWSLVDNFEWERGWTQRFGLWELDVETQARRKRPSADLYAAICNENGISYETVAKYAPQVIGSLFPD